ncbi:hypothetical protein B0H12DRAFT_81967 [Mycena haematopus]|nr:hypothetical protein B0H12DRAFT_81967 [Mycena haematopus]
MGDDTGRYGDAPSMARTHTVQAQARRPKKKKVRRDNKASLRGFFVHGGPKTRKNAYERSKERNIPKRGMSRKEECPGDSEPTEHEVHRQDEKRRDETPSTAPHPPKQNKKPRIKTQKLTSLCLIRVVGVVGVVGVGGREWVCVYKTREAPTRTRLALLGVAPLDSLSCPSQQTPRGVRGVPGLDPDLVSSSGVRGLSGCDPDSDVRADPAPDPDVRLVLLLPPPTPAAAPGLIANTRSSLARSASCSGSLSVCAGEGTRPSRRESVSRW